MLSKINNQLIGHSLTHEKTVTHVSVIQAKIYATIGKGHQISHISSFFHAGFVYDSAVAKGFSLDGGSISVLLHVTQTCE